LEPIQKLIQLDESDVVLAWGLVDTLRAPRRLYDDRARSPLPAIALP
jgi:hypothetical protein